MTDGQTVGQCIAVGTV